ncbi:hypothetical protein FNV43_RR24857 [Rhamnella rubrinervis]|uniref:Uncharacterized protein n=1 Tax=Rhamnella rubrinervis TaxID=2594499 RepID=A0A8K0DT34_9ROSA|nr:hypothetical protein FNV43_RR24857 [Rhamnella rubrinervis]
MRYLYDAIIKVDKAFKKKALPTSCGNKALEEDNLAQTNRLGGHKTGGRSRPGRRKIGSLHPTAAKDGGQEDMEITSGEDEPDEGDAPPVNQPQLPGLNAEPNDSFEEAMRLPSNEESGLGQTSRAANADDGAQN